MKKVIFVLTAWGCIVLMSVVCSCGNGSKPQVNEQSIKDSITKAVKDSMEKIETEKVYNKMHSKESMEKDLKSFLSEYVNTTNDNIEEYLSSDFNAVITKWTNNPNMGEWNLFGLNSSSMVERYTIQNLEGTENNKAKADVLLSIDNEGDYQEETCSIYMVYEKDKWVVDEIDNVKKDMKSIMNGQGTIQNEEPENVPSADGSYSKYIGKWTYFINTQGRRMRCYSAVINDDMTCVFITYTPDGDRNVVNLRKCVFTNGHVYFTDNGDITLKGTPRFRLGPDGLLTTNGDYMVKE